jgi:hypothetical protein
MTDEEILTIARELPLPDGWGFLVGGTPDRPLIIGHYPDGQMEIYIATKLPDGREVQGSLMIFPADDAAAIAERAGRMIADMLSVVRDRSARWN